MTTETDWIEKELVEKLRGTKDRDLRFFRIEEYIRMIHRVGDFGDSCAECRKFATMIKRQNQTIAEAIGRPGRERKELDRLQSELQHHMKRRHGFYPPFYFTYLHSFIWIVALGAGAWLLGYLFAPSVRTVVLLSGLGLGFIVGQVVGGKKDARIRLRKKIM